MHRTDPVDRLYLSPHLDDAALSCGGQIVQATRAGTCVWIVTVMAGDPPALGDALVSSFVAELHARWQLDEDAVAARRAEDRAACAVLGATPHHLDVPDCVYRNDGKVAFYQADAEIFGVIHPQEQALVEELAGRFCRLPEATRVYAPLGIGHHVDHQLVRAAAERVWGVAGLTYYEEYPYAEKDGALAQAFAAWLPTRDARWEGRSMRLTAIDLEAKATAIVAFRSQLSSFFAHESEVLERVTAFAATRGGERLWTARPNG
jgi:LmbE family N-acetylglucosaminyl deacetylase